MAEVVVEAEIFPHILHCLKDADEPPGHALPAFRASGWCGRMRPPACESWHATAPTWPSSS